jgi:ABC-2 type transport system ATP-binding protein
LEEGDAFGFIWPNGAGKTTTIRCLLDLIHPSKGVARIFGLDTRRDSIEIKWLVGYLPSEDFYCRSMPAREVLEYFARLNGLEKSAAAGTVLESEDEPTV